MTTKQITKSKDIGQKGALHELSGRLKIGPMKIVSNINVIEVMRSCGLFFTGDEGMDIQFTAGERGLTILCQGPGVLGYMVDSEGLEAAVSDVERCARDALDGDQVVIVEGEHLLSASQKVICRTIITKKGECVTVERKRHTFGTS